MGKMFGTDGVRGIANKDLSIELAMQIGKAAAIVLSSNDNHKPLFVIGMDTRISSEMLCASITSGICSVGADVLILGVVPTPAVAYLIKKYSADAGIMISASHNSAEYNGIKIFSSDGYKLSEDLENKIEEIVLNNANSTYEGVEKERIGKEVGYVKHINTAVRDYINYLKSTTNDAFSGMNLQLIVQMAVLVWLLKI